MRNQKNSTRKRISLKITFHPYEHEPMKLVVDYLFALSDDERHRQVTNILVPALLPYASYYNLNSTFEHLRCLCWQSQSFLENHLYYMFLTLGLVPENSFLQNQITPEFSQLFKTSTTPNTLYQNKDSTSLILRFQPYEGDPMAEIAKYFLPKPSDEINRQINDILVLALLPYALYSTDDYNFEQLSYLCWRSQESLNKYCHYMRLALGVPEPDSKSQQPSQTLLISDPLHTDTEPHDNDRDINDTSLEESNMSLEDLNNMFGL